MAEQRTASIEVHLTLAEGVELALLPQLEVSLDCATCRRLARTVLVGPLTGACSEGHRFDARLLGYDENGYAVLYSYAPFEDAKYGDASEGWLSWARITFELVCPDCGARTVGSVQSNLCAWTERCECGRTLYSHGEKPVRVVQPAFPHEGPTR